MIRKPPLRTYDRKNNGKPGKLNFATYKKSTFNINAVDKNETKNKEFLDDSLQDPFDSTFDRLLREVKPQPLPPTKKGLSYISSSLESNDNLPSSKMLTPDSEEDSEEEGSLQNPFHSTFDRLLKKYKPQSLPPPKKGLSYISSSSESNDNPSSSKILTPDSEEDSVFDFKQPSPEKMPKLKKKVTKSKKIKKMANNPPKLIKQKAGIDVSKKIKPKISLKVNKRKSDKQQVKLPVKRKRRRINSSSKESLDFVLVKTKSNPASNSKDDSCTHSNSDLADFSFSQTLESIKSSPSVPDNNEFESTKKVQRVTSVIKKVEEKSKKTDSVMSPKIITHLSLKPCSVALKRCDWMIKSNPCLVKIPRFNKKSETKVKISISKKNPEKETKNKVTKNVSVQETGLIQSSKLSSADRTSKLTKNIGLKDCFVKLTLLGSPKTSFSGNLFSSTPFMKKANRDVLSEKLRLMTMEMSNIETPSKCSPKSVPVMESKKASELGLQLEDTISKNNNHTGNYTPKPSEFNTDIWNASSDYSEIDWTTLSLSDSQCVKPPSIREQQKTPVPANQISKDFSSSEDLELISKPFDFITKRNLRVPEYEKSTSMFNDTCSSEKERMQGKLKNDQYSLKTSPLSVKSVVDSSVINQTEFKSSDIQTSIQIKLSPMTAVPTSIIHSLTYEDSEKSFILESEKNKLIRSLALEKKLAEGKSPKKCLIFEEKPTIYLGDNSINKESFDEEFSKYSITQSLKSDSLSEESLFEESNTSNSKTKLINTLKLDDSTSGSSNSLENCEIKEESQKTVKFEEPIPEAVNTSELKIKESSVVSLNCLKDPIRVTHQRKKYRNWGLQLTAIRENDNRRSSVNAVEISPQVEEGKVEPIPEDSPSLCDTICLASNASLNNGKNVEVPEHHLFLKPGKSWARSLSILNNIHSRDDVDRLSVGKGKKWRNSVINILDMQSKGILQSCMRQQDGSKTPDKCGGALPGNSNCESRVQRLSTLGSISPNRFVKRISIRVVPDAKKLDGVEDTQFLEAYGISSSSQTIKTLSQRFSSLKDKHTFIEPQNALVYNAQLEDSVIKTTDTSPLVTAKDVVLERCRQDDYLPFDECYQEKFLQHCRKIGEGVYGEVFLYDNGSDNSVIKIIPIEGDVNVNGEPQKKFHEILSEIVIAKELHDLRFGEKFNTAGFVEVKSIKCIIGKYPSKLVELWKSYDDEKKSENDCPSMFDESQLYISLELGHGGQDLEAFVFQNASESYAVFIQTAFALAVAEQSLEFEHRDLHWGNVLISRSRKSKVSYKLDDKEISFSSSGVKVAIIDFTLSRMSYQSCCIFNDLALDPALFTAEGEYQFEIYRLMRDKIENNWQKFEPFTNVLWLHYTLDKMIHLVRYKKKTTKVHKTAIENLKELKNEILNYESAFDLVTNCDKFTRLYNDLNVSDLSSF